MTGRPITEIYTTDELIAMQEEQNPEPKETGFISRLSCILLTTLIHQHKEFTGSFPSKIIMNSALHSDLVKDVEKNKRMFHFEEDVKETDHYKFMNIPIEIGRAPNGVNLL